MDLVCKDLRLFDKLVDKYNIPAKISKLMNKIIMDLFNYDVIHSEFEEEAAVGAAMIAIPDQN